MHASYCAGGLLCAQEVAAEPDQLIHRLLAYLVARHGLDYRPATPVREVAATATAATVTDARGRRYPAGQVLVCTGRDCQLLFPEVYAQSNWQLCKLQMLATYPLPQVQMPGSVLTGLSLRRYAARKSCPSYGRCWPSRCPRNCSAGVFTCCLSRTRVAAGNRRSCCAFQRAPSTAAVLKLSVESSFQHG